jgi:catechol 2,3-dioxygenase-like lactoylglutathione lyase family enzyme
MPGGMDHVAVAVKDPRRWAQWMCDHLQFRVLFENGQDPPTLLIGGEFGSLIEVMPNNDNYPAARENLDHGISHIAFRVRDVAAAHAALQPHVQNLTEIRPAAGGGTTCFFRGPEDIPLQVVERPKGFGE